MSVILDEYSRVVTDEKSVKGQGRGQAAVRHFTIMWAWSVEGSRRFYRKPRERLLTIGVFLQQQRVLYDVPCVFV